MKVIAINGSARKDGNTAILIRAALAELDRNGIKTELIQLAGQRIRGCTACYKCKENTNGKCVIEDDIVNECIEKMSKASGFILGSPTYFANVSAEMKAVIDRSGLVARANNYMFKRKVGAAVVAVRRAGSVNAFDAINHMYLINQVVIAGSKYWNMGFGGGKGQVDSDTEGIETMKTLGENMAWLVKKINTPE